jgi:hypothetical protein
MVRFILLLRRCASRCGGEYNVRFTLKNMTEVGNKHLYEYFIITDITHKARIYRRNKKDTTAETIKIIDRAHLPGKMALKRKNTAPRQRCMFPRRDAALPDRSGATTRPDHIEFVLGGDQISMGLCGTYLFDRICQVRSGLITQSNITLGRVLCINKLETSKELDTIIYTKNEASTILIFNIPNITNGGMLSSAPGIDRIRLLKDMETLLNYFIDGTHTKKNPNNPGEIFIFQTNLTLINVSTVPGKICK